MGTIFLVVGNAGFMSSTAGIDVGDTSPKHDSKSKYRNPTFYYIGTLGPLGLFRLDIGFRV